MDKRARRVYRGMGMGFVGLGGVFVLVALLERLIGFDFFNSSPVGVALFLIAIGGALLWTVRPRPEDLLDEEDDGEAPQAIAEAVDLDPDDPPRL